MIIKQIAFITDIHLGEQFPIDQGVNAEENWSRIITDLHEKGIKNIVFGGDIGEASAHTWFFKTLEPFSVHLVLGNHDHYDQVSKHFVQGTDVKELFYTLEDSNFKYIFLDSSSDSLSEVQLQWLKPQLVTPKKLVIFMHHPVLAVDTPVDRLYPLKNRDELRSILAENTKPVTVFCGHYHMNHESTFKNITQIITWASSYQIVRQAADVAVDVTTFGYRLIELNEEGIVTQCCDF